MSDLLATLTFGVLILALVLGISCIVMSVSSSKSGAQAMQERIEYGFFGIASLVIALLLVYAMS